MKRLRPGKSGMRAVMAVLAAIALGLCSCLTLPGSRKAAVWLSPDIDQATRPGRPVAASVGTARMPDSSGLAAEAGRILAALLAARNAVPVDGPEAGLSLALLLNEESLSRGHQQARVISLSARLEETCTGRPLGIVHLAGESADSLVSAAYLHDLLGETLGLLRLR